MDIGDEVDMGNGMKREDLIQKRKQCRRRTKLYLLVATVLCITSLAGMAEASTGELDLKPSKVYAVVASSSAISMVSLDGSKGNDKGSQTVQPIHLPANGVLGVFYQGVDLKEGVISRLYQDETCSNSVGSYVYLSQEQDSDYTEFLIPKQGTYYLKTSLYQEGSRGSATIKVDPYFYSGENKVLTSEYQTTYTGMSGTQQFHTLVVKQDALVKAVGFGLETRVACTTLKPLELGVGIYQKEESQSLLLETIYGTWKNYTEYYMLKKGTYYLGASTSKPYALKYSVYSVKDRSGSSKKKAYLLKKGKSSTGSIYYQDSTQKTDWYKVKLTKTGKIKFSFSTKMNGYSELDVTLVSGIPGYRLSNNIIKVGQGTKTITTNRLKKGTYYLKINKALNNYSGAYVVTLK